MLLLLLLLLKRANYSDSDKVYEAPMKSSSQCSVVRAAAAAYECHLHLSAAVVKLHMRHL